MVERDNKPSGRFYESLTGTMHSRDMTGTEVTGSMTFPQVASLIAGIVLLFAVLCGWVGGLQSNGQILGLFAFNGWNTALALVAGILALYAGYAMPRAARMTWTLLAIAYAFMFVVGLIVHGGQVIGLFANNYNNVWVYAILTAGFAYLAAADRRASNI